MKRALPIAVVALACLALPGSALADQVLKIAPSGGGAGTVTSEPAGIDCGGTCSASFPDGTHVVLTAKRQAGTEAVHWGGACAAASGDRCEVTLGAPEAEAQISYVLGWRSQQPAGLNGPTPLGEVGDISCFAPNRCMLITPGNGGVAAGLFAYDGSGWYRYSTVCGGHEGRIAWAGPDDFWTISDQQAGQATLEQSKQATFAVSLCHFVNGSVVASYAEPLGVGTSYLRMNAAACNGPSECWFAGARLPGTGNVGAFHLYWNGLTLSAFPSLTKSEPEAEDPGRKVTGLAFDRGRLYEGVEVAADDQAPAESEAEPFYLHRIIPGTQTRFEPLAPDEPLDLGGPGASPEGLEGFRLADAGEGLWAVAGAKSTLTDVTALRLVGGVPHQLPLSAPGGVLVPETKVRGLAADPGLNAAWVSLQSPGEGGEGVRARVARISADGSVEAAPGLPLDGEASPDGPAGPIACAGPEQCWMSTKFGWLLHLGPPPAEGPNGDPAMHALITFRPADNSLPSVPPVFIPEDNSGANHEKEEPKFEIEAESLPKREPALLSKLKQKLIGHTLELSFVLRAKAHVQLFAKRKGAVVAKTKRYTMNPGKQQVRLKLDPKRWPTKLDLQVHAVKGKKK